MSATTEAPAMPEYSKTDPEVKQAVLAAYIQAGLTLQDGSARDTKAFYTAIYNVVLSVKVDSKDERSVKAITKGNLVKRVFPHLPARGEFEKQDDPALAAITYEVLENEVWQAAKPDFSGPVQKRLKDEGDGYVLCRTHIGIDGVDACYITRNLACIIQDFSKPLKNEVRKKAESLANNLAMAIERIPEHANEFGAEYDNGMKLALDAGASKVAPALSAASVESESDEDDD